MATTTTSPSPPQTTSTPPPPSQPSKFLTLYAPLSALLLTPLLAALPPRKLDLYTLSLLSVFGLSAEELALGHFSGTGGYLASKQSFTSQASTMQNTSIVGGTRDADGSVNLMRDLDGITLGTETSGQTGPQGENLTPTPQNDDDGQPGHPRSKIRAYIGAGKRELYGGSETPGVRDIGLGQRQVDSPQTTPSHPEKPTILGSAREIELGLRAGPWSWERLGWDGAQLLNPRLQKNGGGEGKEERRGEGRGKGEISVLDGVGMGREGGREGSSPEGANERGGGVSGMLRNLWYGSESADWKAKRVREEKRRVEEEGEGVWDLVGRHIGEAFGKEEGE